MEVTRILIRLNDRHPDPRIKAHATVTFDDVFAVHNIRVVDTGNGPFLCMPSVKSPNGKYLDIAHPVVTSFREKLTKAVLGEYNRLLAEAEDAKDAKNTEEAIEPLV